MLVVEANQYYQVRLHLFDVGSSHQPDVTESEVLAFLSLTLQIRHAIQGRLEGYWMKLLQVRRSFYGQPIVPPTYYLLLRLLHFTESSRNGFDRTYDGHDRLWKLRDLFQILKPNFSKFYNTFEHLATDEVIVNFREVQFSNRETRK